MHRFRWPSYWAQLLGELQRQQNNAQFCDTLLQTEGISVPTHSCVLAALSPYLSQKLAVSPSPPSGHKRHLRLQAVNAQTLLKLVGLLYSGELVVKGSNEQNEVMAAAHQFGITDLVEGQNDSQDKLVGSCRERRESLKMQDAQVQVNMAGRGGKNSTVKKKSCVSKGTQTACEKSVGRSVINSGQNKLPNPEPTSQCLDFSISLQPQNITFEQQFSFTTCPNTSRDAEFALTNPTSTTALSSETGTLLNSLTDDSQRAQEDTSYQESSESGVDTQVFPKGRRRSEDGKTNSKTPDNEGNAEEPSQVNREGILRGDNYAEKRRAHTVGKSVDKMKQTMETAQISIKVKLRRRTNGEVWEVVNMQERDETSILKPLKQKPEIQDQLGSASSPKQLNHQKNTSGWQSFSSGSFTPNQSGELTESAPLHQPQGSVEESDEQIERLLEDIMMGLNILPSLERNDEKSQASHDRAPDICQIPGSESYPNQSRVNAGCVFFQDLVTPSGHSSADTGISCCFAGQNQPSCMSLSAAEPDDLIPQQRSPSYDSSVNSLGQRDEIGCRSVPPSNGQDTLHPETSTTQSAMSSAVSCRGQKLHYTAFQQPSSQEDDRVHEFLPQSNGSDTQSFCFPCVDDLQLPRCLSPLESCTSATKHQPLLNTSANAGKDKQQQPLPYGRPWLAENPGSLQFLLSTMTSKEKEAEAQPQDKKHHQELNATNGTSCDEMGSSAGEMRTNSATELTSDPKMTEESLKHKLDDVKRDTKAVSGMKRKYTSTPQDAGGSLLAYKNSKVTDGAKNFYSVSLLNDSPNKPSRLSGNTEGVRRRKRRSWDLTAGQTRIRTRGFVKKCQETVGNMIPVSFSVFKPTVCRAPFVNEQGDSLPKRRRGRPRKMKLEGNPADAVPAITENKSDGVKSELQKEADGKTKSTCRKWRRNQTEVDPPKNAVGAECTGKAEADGSNHIRKLGTPKRPRMVSLKEFQKLIKKQHSKIRKPIESQERSEPGGGEGSEAKKAKAKAAEEAESRERTKPDEDLVIFNMTQDKNNNQMSSVSADQESKTHRGDTDRSANEEISLLASENHPVSSCDPLDKGMVKLSAAEEEALKNPDEGVLCGGSVSMPSAVSNESSHCDTHLFEEDRAALDQNLNPLSSEKTDPLLSDEICKTSGCGEGQDEEEEEEVDVLLYSPDKTPQTRECEESVIMDVTPDEEEEEDVDVIDD